MKKFMYLPGVDVILKQDDNSVKMVTLGPGINQGMRYEIYHYLTLLDQNEFRVVTEQEAEAIIASAR